jgi:hypothetical protein
MSFALRAVSIVLALAFAGAALADDRPLGEPLSKAAEKFGLSAAEVAAVRAAGGEFACPDEHKDLSLLNAWLISDRQVITNAHSIIEGEEKPGEPYIRQPVADCVFISYLELGVKRPTEYPVDLRGLGAVLRRGAKAPVDPTDVVSSDVVRLNLKRPVANGVPLVFDPTPIAKGDALLLISRVPIAYQTKVLPGDDLLIERCVVTSLSGKSQTYSQFAVTDCNGAPGMSAGVLFGRKDGKLVAKGFLVAISVGRPKGSDEEKVLGSYNLVFDAKFQEWLHGDCPFWPAALRISFCGVKP